MTNPIPRLPWWIIAAVATLAVGVAAVLVLPGLSPVATEPTASSSSSASSVPSPVSSLVAAASPTPDATRSAAGGEPASITLMVSDGGYREYRPFDSPLLLSVKATLTGGPAAYVLDGNDTIERDAGEYELKLYHPTYTRGSPARLLCTTSFSLVPGESLLIRIDLRTLPCAPEVTPRPKLTDPASITGTLYFASSHPGACAYVADNWGYYWDVTWPAGYHLGFVTTQSRDVPRAPG